jgi:hypothetical protein
MAHRYVGFLETWITVEKWSQPWWLNSVLSSGDQSLQGYVEQIGWSPGRKQRKMTMDNRTQISETSPSNVEKRNS